MFYANDILAHSPREAVIEEIHVLAYLYHWSAEECWNMPCTERRVFVDRVIRQNKAENQSGKNKGKSSTSLSNYKESR